MQKNNRLLFIQYIALCLLLSFVLSAGCSTPNISGMRTLASMAKDEGRKEEALEAETESFAELHKAIMDSKVQPGLSQEEFVKIYGEPALASEVDNGVRLIYKPSHADWFKGEKIYATFNRARKLISLECLNLECSPS